MQEVERLGGKTRLEDIGMETMEDGTQMTLPPVLLGQIGSDPGKKTVLVYGHLDVQPAQQVMLAQLITGVSNRTNDKKIKVVP